MKHFYIFALLLGIFTSVNAQKIKVTVPYPVAAQPLTRALGSSLLTVDVQYSDICSGTDVTIAFPASVTYVPNSVTKTGGTGSYTIAESNISNLSAPVFTINGPASSVGNITFTVARIADCGSLSNGKDTIKAVGSCEPLPIIENNANTNTYNISAPSLSLTAPASITNAVLGQTTTRTTTVTNGGTGGTDTVRFYIVYPGGGIINNNANKITVSGNDFSPWRTNGDTLFYKIYGSIFTGTTTEPDVSTLLQNGESILIDEPIKVIKCGTTTTYNAYWNRTEWPGCQGASGTSGLVMATGVPNFLDNPVTTPISFSDQCNTITLSATFKNSGTGNATAASMFNVKIRLESYAGGNWSGANQSNFSNFNVNGNATTFTGSNTTMDTVNLANVFTTDPDGTGVGLEDMDGDGFYDDLPPGNTVTLRWDMNLICNSTCGSDRSVGWGYRMMYETMCGGQLLSNIRSVYYPINEVGFGSTSYVPANIVGGVPFRFVFNTAFNTNTNLYWDANGRYQYRLVLPAGIGPAPTPNATYGTASVTYTTVPGPSGDTLIITSPNNVLDSAAINLVLTCGSSGTLNFWHSLLKIPNISTGCYCSASRYCATLTSLAHCPSPCPAGPVNYLPNVRRVDNCLGWTDASLTTRQSANNISPYDLSKALYLDTIQITGSAKQSNDASNLHLMVELPKTSIAPLNVNKLSPVDIYLEIWRGGSLNHSCTVTTISDSSTATMQRIDWDLCLPGGGLLAGDSIYSRSRYVVATNDGLHRYDVQNGNLWYYYNKVAAGKDFCDSWVPEMFLVATYEQIGTNTTNASGCSSFVPGTEFAFMARRFASNGQEYKSEFRPMVYIDSIVFTKTAGYDFVSAEIKKFSGPIGTPQVVLNITPDYVNGNSYTFINPGTWPYMGITKTNNYGGAFVPTVATNCATLASESFNTKIYIRDYYYAFGNPATVPSIYKYVFNAGSYANIASNPGGWNYSLNYSTSSKANVTVQNTTGTVQGVQQSQYWDVKVSSTGTSAAPYVWLALEKGSGSGLINITSVVNLATNTALTSEGSYSGSGVTGLSWYKFSTAGIPSGGEANFRVNFTYSSCNEDSVLFKAGWACSAYPVGNPLSYPCTAAQRYLKVVPNPSQVQLAMVRQPGGGAPTTMCAADYTTFYLNSAQAANLVNPYVRLYPPAGVTISTPIQVTYPNGPGGTVYNLTPTAISGGYQVNLNDIPAISTSGLPGTVLNPGVPERQALVRVDYNTGCNITSGTSFDFYAFGSRPCGQPAIDNGTSIQTGGVSISGISSPGSMGVTMSSSSYTLNCGTSTTLNLGSIAVGTATQAGDTVVYTLPIGMSYVAGSFAGGANCTTCTATVSTNGAGNTIVKIRLDPGIAAGTNIGYTFDVSALGGGCSNPSPITAAAKRDITGLYCGPPIPSNQCSGSSVIIGNASSLNFTINKPTLTVTHAGVVSGNFLPGGTFTSTVTIANSGTVAAAAPKVDYFCGTSTTPFATVTFAGGIPAGTSVTETQSVSVPASPVCELGQVIRAVVRPQSGNGVQCVCDSSSFSMLQILPVNLSEFSALESDCRVLLKWKSETEEGFSRYIVEYSKNGTVYEAIGELPGRGNGSRYSFHHQPEKGMTYYRLKMMDINGGVKYSSIVVMNNICEGKSVMLYPNPSNSVIHVNLSGYTGKISGKLYNGTGQLLMHYTLVNGSNKISTSNLPGASYMLLITDENGEQKSYKIKVIH